jgi:hypothetical protein
LLDYKELANYYSIAQIKKPHIVNWLKVTLSRSPYVLKAKGVIDEKEIHIIRNMSTKDENAREILELATKTVFSKIEMTGRFDIELDISTIKPDVYHRFYRAKCIYHKWMPNYNTMIFTTRIQSIVLALMRLQEISAQDHYEGKLYTQSKIMDIEF